MAVPDIAPAPQFPERTPNVFERKFSAALPGNRGPLRFEEGLGTDTDIPNQFQVGVNQGVQTPPGRPNHNENVYEKYPQETMSERLHVGSAAWVESTNYLGEFAHGSFSNAAEVVYEEVDRNGRSQYHANPARVLD